MLKFGDLILCRYLNFKMDPAPMIFILRSDTQYTEGLNSHYLSKYEAQYVRQLMAYFPNNDGNKVYYHLKATSKAVVNRAYRRYFTNLLVILKQWPVQGPKGFEADKLMLHTTDYIEKKYNVKVPDLKAKLQDAYKEEQRLAKNAKERERYWLNKAKQASTAQEKDAYTSIAFERGEAQADVHRKVQSIAKGLS